MVIYTYITQNNYQEKITNLLWTHKFPIYCFPTTQSLMLFIWTVVYICNITGKDRKSPSRWRIPHITAQSTQCMKYYDGRTVTWEFCLYEKLFAALYLFLSSYLALGIGYMYTWLPRQKSQGHHIHYGAKWWFTGRVHVGML